MSHSLRSRALPWVVLGLGLVLTGVGWLSVHRELQRAKVARFQHLKERVVAAVVARFQSIEEALYAGRAVVDPLPQVPHAQWSGFFSSISRFLDRSVVGLGYVQRIDRSQLDALEAQVRADGMPDFKIERAGVNPMGYIVTHLEPKDRNAAAQGLDIGSGNTRRTAAEEAMRTGRPVISRRIQLVDGPRTVPGCLLLVPVYQLKTPLETTEERSQALRGWVYAPIRVDLLMLGVSAVMEKQLDFEVYDGAQATNDTLLFDSTGTIDMVDEKWKSEPDSFTDSLALPVYGRTWQLRLRALPEFTARGNEQLSFLLLGSGILMSGMAAGFTWVLLNSRARALRLAEQMTTSAQQSEAESRRLALVASHTASSVMLTDADWRIDWVNESFTRFFGYTLEEAKGQRPDQILYGSGTNPDTLAAIAEATRSGGSYKGEILNYTKERQPRWVELDIQPLRDEQGKITGYMGLSLDVTERKQFQEELARKEAQFRFIFEAAPVGFSWRLVRPSGAMTRHVNDAYVRITGVPREEAGDPNVFARITHPDDLVKRNKLMEQLEAGQINQFSMEQRYLRRDGSHVSVVLTRQRNRAADGSYEDLSTIVDLTDLKQVQQALAAQESRFRFIFELVPVGLSWLRVGDPASRIVNTAHTRISGVPEESRHDLEAYRLISHPDDYARQAELTAKLNRGEIDHFTLEKRYLRPEGVVVWVVLTLRNYTDPATGESQQVATLMDITELKQQAEELRGAMEVAERASRAKSQFLAMVSHEIRTPMNGVIGMTSLLLDSPLSKDQQEFVETIRSSGDSLLTIINDILDFSKIESGRLEFEQVEFSVRDCVEGSLDLLAPTFAAKEIDLLYEMADSVPGAVRGDPTRLRQILVNLLGNAVKFTEKGEVVLTVRSTLRDDGRVELGFSVSDTGIGIPAEGMQRLFQAFSQVDASTTRRFGGTGLGLAISRRLAELMGGTMWVESEVGRGSTFHFSLMAVAVASKPRTYVTVGKTRLAGLRLLIVDDNATNRRILSALSAGWGMFARAAASGAEALTWIKDGQMFDLAILDLQMPEMDGAMLAREIRDQPTGLFPLVLLSSLGQRDLVPDKSLFAAFLTKPAKPAQIVEVLVSLSKVGPPSRPDTLKPFVPLRQDAPSVRYADRILLAEDNTVNQRVAMLMLAKLGYRADVAANGHEVLEALQRQPYQVILMDLQMPEMDGLEASRQLRADPARQGDARPWIIALTANTMQGDRELCIAAGMDDYLSKPLKMDELQTSLDHARSLRKK